jgi:hypothetical protein
LYYLGHGTVSSADVGYMFGVGEFQLGSAQADQLNGMKGLYALEIDDDDVTQLLKTVLADGATVRLDCCQSARGPADDPTIPVCFAQEVSRVLSGRNIKVIGWSWLVHSPEMYGVNVLSPQLATERTYIDGQLVK